MSVQKWCCWFGDQIEDYERFYRDLVNDGVSFPQLDPKQLRTTIKEKTDLVRTGKRRCPASFLFVTCYQVKTYLLSHSELVETMNAMQDYYRLLSESLREIRRVEPQSYPRVAAALDLLTTTLQLRPSPPKALPLVPPSEPSISSTYDVSCDVSLLIPPDHPSIERSLLRSSINISEPNPAVLELNRPPDMPRLEEIDSEGDNEAIEDLEEGKDWDLTKVRQAREEFVRQI